MVRDGGLCLFWLTTKEKEVKVVGNAVTRSCSAGRRDQIQRLTYGSRRLLVQNKVKLGVLILKSFLQSILRMKRRPSAYTAQNHISWTEFAGCIVIRLNRFTIYRFAVALLLGNHARR